MISSAIITSLALASSALATVFITEPVSSSVFTAGQPATIIWQDDNNTPSLSQFGNASFGVYVGNALVQTLVQDIIDSVDVSAVQSLVFTPQANRGPNSNEYFIRVTSHSYKDPNQTQYYMESFSSKFTMTGMSGTFNSTLQDEINGQSTAPLATPSAVPSANSTSGGSSASAPPALTVPPSSATGSSTDSSSNGAAKPVIATGFVGLIAAFIGASLL